MKKLFIVFVTAIMLLGACSPKLTTSISSAREPLGSAEQVAVLPLGSPAPQNAVLLGNIRIGDTGFTSTSNGTYDRVIDIAKNQARAAGGNVVLLTNHRPPDFSSSIHRIEAMIYYVEDVSSISVQDSVRKVSSHPDYAILYLYRGGSSAGALVNYDVYVNNTKVYHCSRNTKAEVKIYNTENVTIWAKTEARTELPITVTKGEEYYIDCSVGMGAFIGRPVFLPIDPRTAATLYQSIPNK